MIALTHGHGDHVGDTVALSQAFPEAEIVAIVELKGWLGGKGANIGQLPGTNKGGTQEIDGVRFTLVNAFHSLELRRGRVPGRAVRDRRPARERPGGLLRGRHVRRSATWR